MDQLVEFLAETVPRPVSGDPRNVSPPCVLVTPPRLDSQGTLCAPRTHTLTVLVIGTPGARAELGPLAELLDATLDRLDEGPGWTTAEFAAYDPPGSQESHMCYRITVEEYR